MCVCGGVCVHFHYSSYCASGACDGARGIEMPRRDTHTAVQPCTMLAKHLYSRVSVRAISF